MTVADGHPFEVPPRKAGEGGEDLATHPIDMTFYEYKDHQSQMPCALSAGTCSIFDMDMSGSPEVGLSDELGLASFRGFGSSSRAHGEVSRRSHGDARSRGHGVGAHSDVSSRAPGSRSHGDVSSRAPGHGNVSSRAHSDVSRKAYGHSSVNSRAQSGGSSMAIGDARSGAHGGSFPLDEPGMRPEDFQFIRKLGEGAYAVVELHSYRAPGAASAQPVAVKRLMADALRKANAEDCLRYEIALMTKLEHENIVKFIGYGSWDRTSEHAAIKSLFLVEEYLDGGTLDDLVRKQMVSSQRMYSLQDAVRLLMHVALGLQYLHESDPMVIHRDLKPENVVLRTQGPLMTAKLTDFGLSALMSRNFEHGEVDRPKVSVAGRGGSSTAREAVWTENAKRRVPSLQQFDLRVAGHADKLSGGAGSLLYMAPEVFLNQTYDDKADIFSFGMVAYECLHRYKMISATDGSKKECLVYAGRVAKRGYRPPIDEHLPSALADIIKSCWQHDPHSRPSMAKVAKKLELLLETLDWKACEAQYAEALQQEVRGSCCCVVS